MKLIHCKKGFLLRKLHFLCSDTILQMLLIQIALDLEVPMNQIMIKDLVLFFFQTFDSYCNPLHAGQVCIYILFDHSFVLFEQFLSHF